MAFLKTIQENPVAVSKALTALASAGVVAYFTLVGKPEQANDIVNQIGALAVPVATAIGFVTAIMSTVHFSRGAAPVQPPAPTVTETK